MSSLCTLEVVKSKRIVHDVGGCFVAVYSKMLRAIAISLEAREGGRSYCCPAHAKSAYFAQYKTRQPRQEGEKGSIDQTESPIHHSNAMLYSTEQQVRSRVGHKSAPLPLVCTECICIIKSHRSLPRGRCCSVASQASNS